jgi:acetyl-CoA C-acetyltransferase
VTRAVILSAVRTPIGKFLGVHSPLTAPELGARVMSEAIRRAGIEPSQAVELFLPRDAVLFGDEFCRLAHVSRAFWPSSSCRSRSGSARANPS